MSLRWWHWQQVINKKYDKNRSSYTWDTTTGGRLVDISYVHNSRWHLSAFVQIIYTTWWSVQSFTVLYLHGGRRNRIRNICAPFNFTRSQYVGCSSYNHCSCLHNSRYSGSFASIASIRKSGSICFPRFAVINNYLWHASICNRELASLILGTTHFQH